MAFRVRIDAADVGHGEPTDDNFHAPVSLHTDREDAPISPHLQAHAVRTYCYQVAGSSGSPWDSKSSMSLKTSVPKVIMTAICRQQLHSVGFIDEEVVIRLFAVANLKWADFPVRLYHFGGGKCDPEQRSSPSVTDREARVLEQRFAPRP
jgi:hypothetical protein